jgi:type IV pilus assembly protein PilC
MPAIYHYTARAADGTFVSGSIEAESAQAALTHLRSRSLFITSLELAQTVRGAVASALTLFPIDAKTNVALFRAFSTLIGAGVPMRAALQVVTEQCRSRRLQEALRGIASEIESGAALSTAMARRPREFAPLLVATVRAGEMSGTFDRALERLAVLFERDHAMRRRVTAALLYPAIVVCAATLLVGYLVVGAVPAFAAMFSDLHVALPPATRFLIDVSSALRSPGVWIAASSAAASLVVATRAALHSERLGQQLEGFVLGMPLIGALLRAQATSRFARTLGTLLHAGVPVVTALEGAAAVVGSSVYRHCIEALADSLRRGEGLSEHLRASGLFNGMFLQLVRAGEESGSLDSMLLRIAEYEEVELEAALAMLGAILEHALIIVLGAIVAAIVAAVLIPLYSVIGSIR